jgi:hypothetical protein
MGKHRQSACLFDLAARHMYARLFIRSPAENTESTLPVFVDYRIVVPMDVYGDSRNLVNSEKMIDKIIHLVFSLFHPSPSCSKLQLLCHSLSIGTSRAVQGLPCMAIALGTQSISHVQFFLVLCPIW